MAWRLDGLEFARRLLPVWVAVACVTGYAIARADRVDPIVISQEPLGRIPSPRGGRLATSAGPVNTGAPCLQPAPQPGLTCQNGEWLPPAEEAKGGGGPWRTSGCVTPPPADGFRCQDGAWLMGNMMTTNGTAGSATAGNAGNPATAGAPATAGNAATAATTGNSGTANTSGNTGTLPAPAGSTNPGTAPPASIPIEPPAGSPPAGSDPRPAPGCAGPPPATAPGSSASCVGGIWIIR